MKRALCLIFGLLSCSTARPIDLSPRWIDTFIDGVKFHQLYFADQETKYLVSVDRETEPRAGSGGTVFSFPKFPDITFILTRSRHSCDERFEGSALERYREGAKRLLPVGARGVQVREESRNVLPINNWQSYRFSLNCAIGGRTWRQSVTYLNLNARDQIVLITTAPEPQWEEAEARSFALIRTWREILPDDRRPSTSN